MVAMSFGDRRARADRALGCRAASSASTRPASSLPSIVTTCCRSSRSSRSVSDARRDRRVRDEANLRARVGQDVLELRVVLRLGHRHEDGASLKRRVRQHHPFQAIFGHDCDAVAAPDPELRQRRARVRDLLDRARRTSCSATRARAASRTRAAPHISRRLAGTVRRAFANRGVYAVMAATKAAPSLSTKRVDAHFGVNRSAARSRPRGCEHRSAERRLRTGTT